jgi:uncharacterized protein
MKRSFLKFLPVLILIILSSFNAYGQKENLIKKTELLAQVPLSSISINGYLGDKINLCISQRIKALDFDQFVEPFRHKDETRLWQGEFWGKLMLAAIASYDYNRDPEMLKKIGDAVKGLVDTQMPDGYIGNYSENARLQQWDVWCRKYTLLALLSYFDITGDKQSLKAAVRLADYTLTQLGQGKSDIVKTGNYRGMPSCSILEPIVYLYSRTNDKRYLDFAKYIANQWETPDGPQLISKALNGTPVSERFPQPKSWWSYENGQKAYEMMSCYDGLLELYKITGEENYLKAVEASVKNIIDTEINIAGSGSAFECWYKGSQYQTYPTYHMMETCVTFTWMKLCFNLLRVTGDSRYADQMEKTAYNALLASMKYDGSQIAKYSPLEGTRSEGEKQCGMNINCCNANGPRGFMLIPSFSYMTGKNEIYVNLYSQSKATFITDANNKVLINQTTAYPVSDNIEFVIQPEKPGSFTIALRIPSWSTKSVISVNGQEIPSVTQGAYYRITRTWNKNDKIDLKLEMTGKIVSINGYQAITRGPVVLARDARYKDGDIDETAVISRKNNLVELKTTEKKTDNIWMSFTTPMVLGTDLEGESKNPKQVNLCDFSSAGNTWSENSRYRVWIRQTLNVMNSDYKGY